MNGLDGIRAFLDVLPPQMRDPGAVRDPVLPAAADPGVDGGAQARAASSHRRARAVRGLSAARRVGEHLDGPGVGRRPPGAWKVLALLGYAALYAYVAPWHLPSTAWYTWVIAHPRRRPAVLRLPPHRAPGTPGLGHAPGAPLQPVLQLRHRTAAEVEQQRRDPHLDSAAAAGRSAVDGVRQLLGQPGLPVLGAHRAHRQDVAARSNSSSTRRRTTACITAWTRSTSTRTTAASSSCGTGSSAPIADEMFRPHYGLTKQVSTYNIWKLQTHEYVAIARDVRRADRLRDRLGYVFGPPGWEPRRPRRRGRAPVTRAVPP